MTPQRSTRRGWRWTAEALVAHLLDDLCGVALAGGSRPMPATRGASMDAVKERPAPGVRERSGKPARAPWTYRCRLTGPNVTVDVTRSTSGKPLRLRRCIGASSAGSFFRHPALEFSSSVRLRRLYPPWSACRVVSRAGRR